uniref:Putative LOC100214709 [Hydra vulgaris] n=1 Tax=Lepeophtheirus salmonis TaxID=72036 RepID=A0A0K2UK34_LEPSM
MIKIVLGRYNMVAMIPITKVSSSIIKEYYMKVLSVVTQIGFETVATMADAHPANRMFFPDEHGNGTSGEYILNPFANNQQKIYLLFDPFHIFKNFYHQFHQ